jgi:hypothetical protein
MACGEVTGLMVVPTVVEASLARVASAMGDGPVVRGTGDDDGAAGLG